MNCQGCARVITDGNYCPYCELIESTPPRKTETDTRISTDPAYASDVDPWLAVDNDPYWSAQKPVAPEAPYAAYRPPEKPRGIHSKFTAFLNASLISAMMALILVILVEFFGYYLLATEGASEDTVNVAKFGVNLVWFHILTMVVSVPVFVLWVREAGRRLESLDAKMERNPDTTIKAWLVPLGNILLAGPLMQEILEKSKAYDAKRNLRSLVAKARIFTILPFLNFGLILIAVGVLTAPITESLAGGNGKTGFIALEILMVGQVLLLLGLWSMIRSANEIAKQQTMKASMLVINSTLANKTRRDRGESL